MRVGRIELPSYAWEAHVLPLNHTRLGINLFLYYSRKTGLKSMSEKFQRTIEDFVCEQCGQKVVGSGFTNHCPKCLWCKHVDNFPGDRANLCHGPMEPIGVELEKGEYIIIHKCLKCHKVVRNKTQPGDDVAGFLADML